MQLHDAAWIKFKLKTENNNVEVCCTVCGFQENKFYYDMLIKAFR